MVIFVVGIVAVIIAAVWLIATWILLDAFVDDWRHRTGR